MVPVVVTARGFDFTNGVHDTANAVATSIATGLVDTKVADELAGSGPLASIENSAEVVRRAISSATRAPVDELAVARVQDRLRAAGWDLDDLPSS